jgi:hypothetical protein
MMAPVRPKVRMKIFAGSFFGEILISLARSERKTMSEISFFPAGTSSRTNLNENAPKMRKQIVTMIKTIQNNVAKTSTNVVLQKM